MAPSYQKLRLMHIGLLLLFLNVAPAVFAQDKHAVPFAVEKLKQDLDTLYKTILASHPKPEGFLTLNRFTEVYDSLQASIVQPLDQIAFSEVIAQLIGTISDLML